MFCYALSYASSSLTQIILIFFAVTIMYFSKLLLPSMKKKSFLVKKNSSMQLIYSNERLKSKWIQYSRT